VTLLGDTEQQPSVKRIAGITMLQYELIICDCNHTKFLLKLKSFHG